MVIDVRSDDETLLCQKDTEFLLVFQKLGIYVDSKGILNHFVLDRIRT